MRQCLMWTSCAVLLMAGSVRAGDFRSDMETIESASRHNDVAELVSLTERLGKVASRPAEPKNDADYAGG